MDDCKSDININNVNKLKFSSKYEYELVDNQGLIVNRFLNIVNNVVTCSLPALLMPYLTQ
jgi:hypothetical protein